MKKNFFFAIISLVSLICGSVNAQTMPTVATDVSPVIIFYRGVWCPNCIKSFQEEFKPNLVEIERSGYSLITICPDTPTSLMGTSKQAGMESKYFYGDPTGKLSKAI